MRLPCLLLIGTCLAAAAAGEARACPDPGAAKSAESLRPASASRLLAWRPRAWSIASHAPATGLRVSIDPVDGAYGMPAGDALSASAVVSDDAPVSVVRRANGSGFAKLDDRFAEFAVVAMGADGKPHWTCVHGTAGASGFMQHPIVLTPAPAGEVK